MLDVARQRLGDRVEFHAVTVQELSVPARQFDLAIAGWVLGHFVAWHADRWREEIGQALGRMGAALRPGGVLAIIETLGSGAREPCPPTPGLGAYYDWLERERGFARTVLRTDYSFPDVERAAAVTGAFFGPDFAARVRQEQWVRVPECTGLWWRRAAAAFTPA